MRVPAVLLPVSGRLLQVAGLPGRRHASPNAPAQVHHHAAGQTPDSPEAPLSVRAVFNNQTVVRNFIRGHCIKHVQHQHLSVQVTGLIQSFNSSSSVVWVNDVLLPVVYGLKRHLTFHWHGVE